MVVDINVRIGRSMVRKVLSSRTFEPSSSGCMPLSESSVRTSACRRGKVRPARRPRPRCRRGCRARRRCRLCERAARPRGRAGRRNVERCLGSRIERQFQECGGLDRHESPVSSSLFQNRLQRRHRCIAVRDRLAAEQRMVDLQVVLGHAGGGKPFLETPAHCVAIERQDLRQHLRRSSMVSTIRPVTPGSTISGTEPQRKRAAACRRRLDHGEPERLRPVDREQQRASPRNSLLARSSISRCSPRPAGRAAARWSREIGFVDLVDLGGDLIGMPTVRSSMARSALLRRDAAQKRQIAAAGIVRGLEQMNGKPVQHGGDEVCVGDRLSLRVEIDTRGMSLKPI